MSVQHGPGTEQLTDVCSDLASVSDFTTKVVVINDGSGISVMRFSIFRTSPGAPADEPVSVGEEIETGTYYRDRE